MNATIGRVAAIVSLSAGVLLAAPPDVDTAAVDARRHPDLNPRHPRNPRMIVVLSISSQQPHRMLGLR